METSQLTASKYQEIVEFSYTTELVSVIHFISWPFVMGSASEGSDPQFGTSAKPNLSCQFIINIDHGPTFARK